MKFISIFQNFSPEINWLSIFPSDFPSWCFLNEPFPASFSLFSSFLGRNWQIITFEYQFIVANVGIWTTDLWCRKRPLCQLRHNHGPTCWYFYYDLPTRSLVRGKSAPLRPVHALSAQLVNLGLCLGCGFSNPNSKYSLILWVHSSPFVVGSDKMPPYLVPNIFSQASGPNLWPISPQPVLKPKTKMQGTSVLSHCEW